MTDMPYKRNGGCDLCGRMAPLSRVELAAGTRDRLARAAYICDRHPELSRAPLVAPQQSPPLSPQGESLF